MLATLYSLPKWQAVNWLLISMPHLYMQVVNNNYVNMDFFFPFQFLFLLSNIDVRFRSQMTLLLAENIMKYMYFVELERTSEWHRFIQAYIII